MMKQKDKERKKELAWHFFSCPCHFFSLSFPQHSLFPLFCSHSSLFFPLSLFTQSQDEDWGHRKSISFLILSLVVSSIFLREAKTESLEEKRDRWTENQKNGEGIQSKKEKKERQEGNLSLMTHIQQTHMTKVEEYTFHLLADEDATNKRIKYVYHRIEITRGI